MVFCAEKRERKREMEGGSEEGTERGQERVEGGGALRDRLRSSKTEKERECWVDAAGVNAKRLKICFVCGSPVKGKG